MSTEGEAKWHYLRHGLTEKRLYAPWAISPNPKYENASVFIAGTSREIEVFENKGLVERLERKLPVFCINTAYHYFNRISCLFLNGRFRNMRHDGMTGKEIDEIYAPFDLKSGDRTVRNFRIIENTKEYSPEISIDLNNALPHGPTTLLDIVFPFCAFHKVRRMYILGAEYNMEDTSNLRHTYDSLHIDRSNPRMDRQLEYRFAMQKLDAWKEFFSRTQTECFVLSDKSKTPFQKMSLRDVLDQ